MKTDIEIKLEKALILEITQIKEAIVNGILKNDFRIIKVEYIHPTIVTPSEILNGDYINAKKIQFRRGQLMVSEPCNNGFMENMYYFDGDATISYLNNNFLVNVIDITIYTK